MRGVRFCQIPTTLLAMVDSSVGGKTAIDTPHGKNLIGAFWQPEYIFIDAAFLETLPVHEFSNGMAEVVKTAAIWSADEFALLESRAVEIFAAIQSPCPSPTGRTLSSRTSSQGLLLSLIHGSISVKAHIVTIDERETGLRNLVNFGHTIGHAIEAVLTPTILHGECVSIGMILEAEVARSLGVFGQVGVGRLTRCLKAYNLPVSLEDPRIKNVPASKLLGVEKLLDIMRIDKKNSGAAKKIVILSRIGATYEQKATVVADDIIAKVLSQAAKVVPGTPSKHPIRMATPGSKSISNRALVLAALGKGTCRLKNLLHSDDTQVMMNALIELEVRFPLGVRVLHTYMSIPGRTICMGRQRRNPSRRRRAGRSVSSSTRQRDLPRKRRHRRTFPHHCLHPRPIFALYHIRHHYHRQCAHETAAHWAPS